MLSGSELRLWLNTGATLDWHNWRDRSRQTLRSLQKRDEDSMTEQRRRAVIYGRVSTQEQSVDMQVAELTDYAEKRGWQLVGQYLDCGVSGGLGARYPNRDCCGGRGCPRRTPVRTPL